MGRVPSCFEGVQHFAILSVRGQEPIILIGESHDESHQAHMIRSLCREGLTQCNPNIDFILEQGRHRIMHSAVMEVIQDAHERNIQTRTLGPVKMGNYRRRHSPTTTSKLDRLHTLSSMGDKVSCIGAMTEEADHEEVCTDMVSCRARASGAGIKFHICDFRSTLSHEGPYVASFVRYHISRRDADDRIRQLFELLMSGINESVAYVSSAVEQSFGECHMDLPEYRESPCGQCALFLREEFHHELRGMTSQADPKNMSKYRLDPGLEACAFAKLATTHKDRLGVMFFGYHHTLNICRVIRENPEWGIHVECEVKNNKGSIRLQKLLVALDEHIGMAQVKAPHALHAS